MWNASIYLFKPSNLASYSASTQAVYDGMMYFLYINRPTVHKFNFILWSQIAHLANYHTLGAEMATYAMLSYTI